MPGIWFDSGGAGSGSSMSDAEVKTAYENNADTNAFDDAEQSKLAAIEASATADQTGAQIKTAYQAEANAFTDTKNTKLTGIETSATADQSNAEIRTAVGAASDSNVFDDAAVSKLGAIEASADVTDAANVAAAGGAIVSTGAGSPSSTPSAVGDIYVDTTGDIVWVATDTASSADWDQATGAGGGDLLAANNLGDVASAATSFTNIKQAASTTATGVAELATITEVNTGTDAARVVTPAGLAGSALQTKVDGIEASATADQTGAQIKTAYQAEANAFTDAQFTKLAAVEASATADQSAAQIKTAYEGEANAFTDAQFSKLAAVEASADVTDVTNVTAAGALMDSEVDADIKTLVLPASTTISAFGASLVDDADAATALATLGAVSAAVFPSEIIVAGSDEVTAIVAATGVMQFRMPYAMTGTSIRASVGSAASTGTFTVDVNIGGATVLSTKVTIDATEKTSQTAVTASVLSDTAWADDEIVTVDVDVDGDATATGLKVTLIGTRAV